MLAMQTCARAHVRSDLKRAMTHSYSNLVLNASAIGPCDSVALSVDVTNTGTVASDEVIQAYITTPHATLPSPKIRLADFERVHAIAPGAKVTVQMMLVPQFHSVVHDDASDESTRAPRAEPEGALPCTPPAKPCHGHPTRCCGGGGGGSPPLPTPADFWNPTIEVEAGDFVVHVGGGQPGFTEGVLNRTVTVRSSGKLSRAFRCKTELARRAT